MLRKTTTWIMLSISLLPLSGFGGDMSAQTKGKGGLTGYPTYYSDSISDGPLSITFISRGDSIDDDPCITPYVLIWGYDKNKTLTKIIFTSWGASSNTTAVSDVTSLEGYLYNNCNKVIDGTVIVSHLNNTRRAAQSDMHVSAASVCRASVSDLILPRTQPGSQYSVELPIVTNDLRSSVTISGSDLQTSGTLNLNSSKDITVTPRDSDNIDPKTGNWIVSGKINPQIPLSVTVGSGAHAGKYSSTMTATLTCE